jgi:hypothetical protein
MYTQLLRIAAAICLACLLPGLTALAQDKDIPADLYKAATIPDSLKKDANSVVRYSFNEVTIKAAGKAVSKEHTIITVLNDKAEKEAVMVLFYDKKFNSINSAEMIVYNADGKLIKKYRKGDMYDRSATDGISIITDDRLLAAEHTITSYPVTIEKIVEQSANSYLTPREWVIQGKEEAVENAVCQVNVNPAVGFRYKNYNVQLTPQKTSNDNLETYTWTIKNLKAIKPEEEAVDWRVLPKVSFATNTFEFYGIPGDISNWQNYGKWQKALNADVCSLTPKREEEIRLMVADLKTDKEKVKFLYNYLQKNVRYVSVALGIGGLKPFPATFVDQKKYGDCKALSNYMSALLKAVNIPSYYTMIRAGANEEPADRAFPTDPFNHIILCVPLKGDTTWLECTSNTQPFGKLGTFTENRNGLLITEDGGKLVNTPKSNIADNWFKSEVHILLDADGGAKAKMKAYTAGEYRALYLSLGEQKVDFQKEYLIRSLNIRQPSVLNINNTDDKDGVKELDLDLEYDRFCDIMAGDKQFYKPQVFDLWRLTVPVLEKRKTDYYFEHPMAKTCVTTIDLPAGYEVETLPANADLKFTYGNFKLSYVYDAAKNQLVSTAMFNLTNHVIPAAKYNEMQQYMDNVARAQNKKLVIKKKA